MTIVHSVGKTETLADIPLKYFVVVPYYGDYHIIVCDTKEEAMTFQGCAIIKGFVIKGYLE